MAGSFLPAYPTTTTALGRGGDSQDQQKTRVLQELDLLTVVGGPLLVLQGHVLSLSVGGEFQSPK